MADRAGARIIAVANQKGGVAKTTSTVNLAYGFARLGRRVLLVDADPQGSATVACGLDAAALDAAGEGLLPVLEGRRPLAEVVREAAGIDVAPGGISMAGFEASALSKVGHERRLFRALADLRDRYDEILIDTPPHLSVMTRNALIAAGFVLIPTVPAPLDVLGIPLLLDTIGEIRTYENPELTLLGILPTKFEKGLAVHQAMLAQLRQDFAGRLRIFEPVRKATGFDQALFNGVVALHALPADHPVQAYAKLAEELLEEGRR